MIFTCYLVMEYSYIGICIIPKKNILFNDKDDSFCRKNKFVHMMGGEGGQCYRMVHIQHKFINGIMHVNDTGAALLTRDVIHLPCKTVGTLMSRAQRRM